LKIADLDFARKLIYVRKTMYRQSEQTPKTKNARRRITVKPYVMNMLQKYLLNRGISSGLVFRSRIGTPLVNTTVLDKHLHPLQERLGIPMGGMHGFRHFRVSYLVEHGVPDNIVMDWIGHGSAAMIRLYTHLRPQQVGGAAAGGRDCSRDARGRKC
jgi:integrase